MCALAKKCAGKPMVSCLMGDSTALASAIVRCCPNSISQNFHSCSKSGTASHRCDIPYFSNSLWKRTTDWYKKSSCPQHKNILGNCAPACSSNSSYKFIIGGKSCPNIMPPLSPISTPGEKAPTALHAYGRSNACANAPYPPIDNPAIYVSSIIKRYTGGVYPFRGKIN